MKRTTVVLGAMLLALTSACSGSESRDGNEGSDAPYRMLFVGPLSGPAASVGEAQTRGIKAGIEAVNASGGINGRDVELVTQDDGGDPTKAITLLQQEMSKKKPDLVIPGVSSDVGLSMLPLLTERKILAMGGLTADAVNDTEKYPYFFSAGQTLLSQGRVLAQYLVEEGHTKVAFLRPDSALGISGLRVFELGAEGTDLDVTDYKYDLTSVDLSDVVARVAADEPDVIVANGYGAPVGYFLQARQKLKLDIPSVGDLTTCSQDITTLVPAATLEGYKALCQAGLFPDWNPPGMEQFRELIGDEPFVQSLNAYSGMYDMVLVAQAAAEKAGSTDTEAMAEAMLELPDSLADKIVTYSTWSYTADDHLVQVPEEDYRIVDVRPMKNGQFVS